MAPRRPGEGALRDGTGALASAADVRAGGAFLLSARAQAGDMGKVSIALRGWRFEEEEVFAPDGRLRPLEEMPDDAAERLLRLPDLVGSPCDACWLVHGDEALEQCQVAQVVYGEPLAEVVLCDDHEDDFVYWYREAGGSAHRGEPELQDAFHEWFADGGRAPEGYEGVEHVDTDPQALPDLPDDQSGALDMHLPDEKKERIDLEAMEVHTGEDADRDGDDDEADDLDDLDVDLTRDYPG